MPFPEPTAPAGSRAEVFLRYLDYFRSRLAAKLESLPAAELARSRLASGWTPLELAKHLRYVELRWLEWGFEGRDVADPSLPEVPPVSRTLPGFDTYEWAGLVAPARTPHQMPPIVTVQSPTPT